MFYFLVIIMSNNWLKTNKLLKSYYEFELNMTYKNILLKIIWNSLQRILLNTDDWILLYSYIPLKKKKKMNTWLKSNWDKNKEK